MAETIFFLIALSTCVFALFAVLSQNIFHCAVWLAMTLLSIAGIYFYLEAEFLGVVQVLVYVGGIITLFVFAIMLTARISDRTVRPGNKQIVPSAAVSLFLFYLIAKVIGANPWRAAPGEERILSIKELGQSLITVYALPFEFISLILLAAMVGAIVLGKVKP